MNIMDCREVSRVVASDGLGASHWARIATHLHLLMCRGCRAYKQQLRLLQEVARETLQTTGPEGIAAREALAERIVRHGR
jgi:hypothetical protein